MVEVVFKFRNRPMNVKKMIVNADDDGFTLEFVESEVHSTITPKIYFGDLCVQKDGNENVKSKSE